MWKSVGAADIETNLSNSLFAHVTQGAIRAYIEQEESKTKYDA